jgi:hypothetical protein
MCSPTLSASQTAGEFSSLCHYDLGNHTFVFQETANLVKTGSVLLVLLKLLVLRKKLILSEVIILKCSCICFLTLCSISLIYSTSNLSNLCPIAIIKEDL